MTFGRDLGKFKRKTLEKYVTVKRLSAIDLFSAIILGTPVDKGVLRNNWFAEIGGASSETTGGSDKEGQGTINRNKAVLEGTDIDRSIFFTNNLPYAVPIEFDGVSGKAERGMVRINTANWADIVRRNARAVNGN